MVPGEVARKLGIRVAINIIADAAWDEIRFARLREWAMQVPEIVHVTVQTPYPGTETWHTESRRLTTLDYRLFDAQHAVLPMALPLERFYQDLVKTRAVLNRKHLGWRVLLRASRIVANRLLRGQTNFVRMLRKFRKVCNVQRQAADHERPVSYEIRPPAMAGRTPATEALFVRPAPSERVAAPQRRPAPVADPREDASAAYRIASM